MAVASVDLSSEKTRGRDRNREAVLFLFCKRSFWGRKEKSVFEKKIVVPKEGLSTQALFHELQELSGDAVSENGCHNARLKEKGLMWVVVRYDVRLTRALRGGESLKMLTWAEPFRHGMSKRNYRLSDEAGELALEGSGVWSIVDRETRAMIRPEDYEIVFVTENSELDPPRPAAPEKGRLLDSGSYSVPPEVLDENGHMNNTRYFSLAEALPGAPGAEAVLRRARVAYQNEARLGEELKLQWGRDGQCFYVIGTGERGICFQMSLDYA